MNAMRTPFAMLLSAFLAVAFVAAPARADDTELGKSMEELGKHLKAIKKNIKDTTKNEEALKLVVLAQAEALKGKGLPPAMLAKAPEAEKAKILAG